MTVSVCAGTLQKPRHLQYHSLLPKQGSFAQ